MITRIVTTVLYLTLLTGCASQTLQLPISTDDPANPNAPESVFTQRPNFLQAEVPVRTEQPVTEPTSPIHPPSIEPPITYTCPMHPEAVQSVQGKCPKCGMRLVPSGPSKTDSVGRQ